MTTGSFLPPEWNSRLFSLAETLRAEIDLGRLSTAEAESLIARDIALSSRKVAPGTLFVAISGAKADGHAFLADAAARGAVAAVVQRDFSRSDAIPDRFPLLRVGNTKVALSLLSSARFQEPSSKLRTIGITGTNGKTTSNWLVFHLLNRLGHPSLRIGTLGTGFGEEMTAEGALTTPDAVDLHRLMAEAVTRKLKSCVMEVSSHALDQSRADHVEFDVAAFTNLTRDHLDYHGSMESYFRAKKQLFELLAASPKRTRVAVIGIDDPYGLELAQALKKDARLEVLTFGFDGSCVDSGSINSDSAIRISDYREDIGGSRLTLKFRGEQFAITSAFIGRHNAHNLATAFGCVVGLGIEPRLVAEQLASLPQVPGRLERVRDADPSVYVDYAHTPDALEKALSSLKEITPGKLWAVFGCGGDRDGGKRPLMADVAAALADRVVVTSDNPRTENPDAIIAQILSGKSGSLIRESGIVEADRREAIQKTLRAAGPGDVVLIAGKGHEDYQIIGTTKHHFSDQEEVRAFFCSAPARS
jgi:UDP-N-acetylmuramoyl-L-alanyl-D-glutamate--2,6-diaminopimelate ligase